MVNFKMAFPTLMFRIIIVHFDVFVINCFIIMIIGIVLYGQ